MLLDGAGTAYPSAEDGLANRADWFGQRSASSERRDIGFPEVSIEGKHAVQGIFSHEVDR
jgi:hypothetical protein